MFTAVSKQLCLDILEILKYIPLLKAGSKKTSCSGLCLVWISWRIEKSVTLLGHLFHCLSRLTVEFSFLTLSRVYWTSVHAHCFSTWHQAPLRWVSPIFQESWSSIGLMTPSQWQWSLHWAHNIGFALLRQSGAVEMWVAMFRLPFLY